MENNDPRRRYTKAILKEACITCLKQKSISQISVREICAVTQVNRSTFYRYYSDIYALKEEIEDDCIRMLTENLSIKRKIDGNELLENVFSIMSQEETLSLSVARNLDTARISSKIIEYYRRDILKQWRERNPQLSDDELDCMFTALMGSLSTIVSRWVRSGMPEHRDEIFHTMKRLRFLGLF